MSRQFSIFLFLAGLLLFGAAAALQRWPGYMDAEYYYAGARLLAAGEGGAEPYLWNFLNDPAGLPAPAFAYWMPLVSLLAAPGVMLGLGWWGARLPLILLAACVPVLTAALARRLGAGPFAERLAGLLALFPGFYLAYMGTTDSFAVSMVLGGLFLLTAFDVRLPANLRIATTGLLAGWMHLARADGLLWLAAAVGVVVWDTWQSRRAERFSASRLWRLMLPLAMYALVMAPWYARNLLEWGALFPPGNGWALWLTEYGQTMIFPAGLLTVSAWQSAGWGAHLADRLAASLTNMQTAVAVQGGVVLFPFMALGAFRLRRCPPVVLGLSVWALTLAAMTLAFPYAGPNGGFFHSGAAVQPLLWALAPVGLELAVQRVAAWRRWQRGGQVLRFLAVLLLVTGALLSAGLYGARVIGSEGTLGDPQGWAWHRTAAHYRQVEAALQDLGAAPGQAVLVNDPPGYWLYTGRPAVVIPYGDEAMLLQAARRYQADWLVLEETNPPMLAGLYSRQVEPPALEWVGQVGRTGLYSVRREGGEE